MDKKVLNGVVHRVPADLKKIIISKPAVLAVWQSITPLARNEWLCWIESAVKTETRERRIKIMLEKLIAGEHRPCCWAGCPHRKDK
jgi:uncharacterized protein YdeI (YjbR/CyaY-like superfamily)